MRIPFLTRLLEIKEEQIRLERNQNDLLRLIFLKIKDIHRLHTTKKRFK